MVGNSVVVCPLHDWRFDLATGQPTSGECGIEIYPVRKTEDHEIVLMLDGG